jgi:hypothetical protein
LNRNYRESRARIEQEHPEFNEDQIDNEIKSNLIANGLINHDMIQAKMEEGEDEDQVL